MAKKNTINLFSFFWKLANIFITILSSIIVIKILHDNSWAFIKLLNFEPKHVLFILILFFVLFIISFIPVFLIFKRLSREPITFWQLLPVLTIGRMANILAPRSGIIYKAFAFKSNFNLSYTQYINIFALFSWLTLLLNLFLAAFMILMVMPGLKLFQFSVLYIIIGFFGVVLTGPFLIHYILLLFKFKRPLTVKIHEKLTGLFQAMTAHGKDKRLLSHIFFFSVSSFVLTVVLFKLIFVGMNVPIGYEHIALLSIVRKISNLFFITPGNIGVQELLYGAVCESIGIGTAQGIIVSVILRLVGYIIIFPMGIAFGGIQAFNK